MSDAGHTQAFFVELDSIHATCILLVGMMALSSLLIVLMSMLHLCNVK